MRASGFHVTRLAVCAPAIFAIAAIISATLTVMPGRLTTRFDPHFAAARSWACINASTTRRGESSHTPVSGGSGHSEPTPLSGARTSSLADDVAPAFGLRE